MPPKNSNPPRINIDDEVDDLDEILDEFSADPIRAPPPTSLGLASGGRPRQNTRVDAAPPSLPGSSGSKLVPTEEANEDDFSDEFVKQLAQGMENLMKELDQTPSHGADGKELDEESRKAFRAAWEAIMVESGGQSHPEHEKEKTATDFKSRLQNAIDNLKESESKLQGTSDASGSDSVESLINSLGKGEPELDALLEKMMIQLLSKDVLRDPLKELSDRFPSYLENPPTSLSDEDRQRYLKQQSCVAKILDVFDKSDYTDDHPRYSLEIMELMSEMQSYGSPPGEIMGDLPPGFENFDDKQCLIS